MYLKNIYLTLNRIKSRCVEVVIYELVITEDEYYNSKTIKDLEEFKKISDVIVANRLNKNLLDVNNKVYTKDMFNIDS